MIKYTNYLVLLFIWTVNANTIMPSETIELGAHFNVKPTPVLEDIEGTEEYKIDGEKSKEEPSPIFDGTTEGKINVMKTIKNTEVDIDMTTSEPPVINYNTVLEVDGDLLTGEPIVATAVVKTKSMFQTTLPIPPLDLIPPGVTEFGGELRDVEQTVEPTFVFTRFILETETHVRCL